MYSETASRIIETYDNAVRPHGCDIYNTAAYMYIETMCPCPYKQHVISKLKYV